MINYIYTIYKLYGYYSLISYIMKVTNFPKKSRIVRDPYIIIH